MTPLPSALLLTGLSLGVLGALTATDLVSLRDVAHAVDVPLLSGLVLGLRAAMPSSLAHAIEPATGVIGAMIATGALWRPSRALTQRTVLALAVLRAG